jgi:hypothetical protein
MKLYFTCPIKKETFASGDYSLHPGHSIVTDDKGGKELQGTVSLNTACPFCGQKHQYAVKDVLCPLSRGTNER